MNHKNEQQAAVEHFPEDIKKHQLIIFKDEGLYRHIRMARPGTNNMSFDIVTWPGHLAYSGDMGCYVFSRITDMFMFFTPEGSRRINPGYWAEKLQAADKNDGYKKYSPEIFRSIVEEELQGYCEDLSPGDANELRIWVEDEVLSAADDGAWAAHQAARDFRWHNKEVFRDFWEHSLDEYSYRYIWCCLAIVHTVEAYRFLKTLEAVKADSKVKEAL